MNPILSTLVALVGLLAICCGYAVADAVPADPNAMASPSGEGPTGDFQNAGGNVNATVAGNNVLVTRSNIIIVTDQDKRGVVDFIKKLVLRSNASEDEDPVATQIIALLNPRNTTTDLAAKMMPNIKSAIRSRNKPAQLHQIIVKLTEMSPKFKASDPDNRGE
ncbi:hypothetical protein PHYSODRAFT_257036 [Phytophthora sojae]|uniref:RxLR effector protein n=1 Tax=Phytophthora sojae (strain P6497) TaxID=1094619 RepID=G4YTR5_PHYSP|nr:hypothetical protein PHYSODRAFT_325873 [Phytophthora sojae]XP_009520090.1 hypothetical protein PHYSODRAFT_482392 [Phytophthora sojae]XP_009520094.1 hypothetical protein PHYSODRAFT_257036 [Phytophthora sojae]EGZ24800.1 hypothetical protein PHYSODRAFT_325873 [Phytophthora sojae]EGZ24802.1 hypothetical protein PHYSODRAFT_482392 [Phytophthora sojae]EGZ24806.1 hypothetical protein PHYSODRAFT_257036 [Phytophthora sojae]|eukprot:XP_009520088.1 hypothetical protein PHYSODRAFT_325873 [Phytophthora sojae]